MYDSWHTFVQSKLLICLRIFSLPTISKENKSFQLETLLKTFVPYTGMIPVFNNNF